MLYKFPIIDSIHDVIPAISGKEEFIIVDRQNFKIINYFVQYEKTFEDPLENSITAQESRYRAIRRECRGIIFDAVTSKIIRRPLSKFFNLNEKLETSYENIDISLPHVILQKLDGSFISPFLVNGQLIYGTKMGWTSQTDQVNNFLKDKPQYDQFSMYLITNGMTPIFEYISPLNRIIIKYQESSLTLLAIRDMKSGNHMTYNYLQELCNEYDIPLVKALPGSIKNMQEFVNNTKALTGEEGYVIRFDTGQMIKMKSDEYVLKHKTKDGINLEKNIIELIFSDKIDDTYAILDKEDADKVKTYADSVLHNVATVAQKITDIVAEQKILLNNDKKRFAVEIIPQHKEYSNILFAVWDGKDALETIRAHILKNCSTQTKVNSMRHFLGSLVWNDVYTAVKDD